MTAEPRKLTMREEWTMLNHEASKRFVKDFRSGSRTELLRGNRIHIDGKWLSFRTTPKCGSSALKDALIRYLFGDDLRLEEGERFPCHEIINALFHRPPITVDMSADIRLVLVRDPVQRYISCWRNRVCGALGYSMQVHGKTEMSLADTINQHEELLKYRDYSWHIQPIHRMVPNPQDYTHIVDTRALGRLGEILDCPSLKIGYQNVSEAADPALMRLDKPTAAKLLSICAEDYRWLVNNKHRIIY